MKISSIACSFAAILAAANAVAGEGVDCVAPCEGDVCTYHIHVNLHAGELGYFEFEECGDKISPTIGVEVGKTYHFIQANRTNYYHPMGFAYYPDGDHAGKEELEPDNVPPGSSSTCDTTETCPAPKYYQDGVYLGDWMSDDSNVTSTGDFGLDHYEPKFYYPMGEWLDFGTFESHLTFDVTDFAQDFFYFCHIHQFMTGRIKLVDSNGDALFPENKPPLEYSYDVIQPFDKTCGTFNTSDYQLPDGKFSDQCPERFVCDVAQAVTPEQGSGPSNLETFAGCMDAMNCAMMVGMTTNAYTTIGLFVHQMVPHHQNAVNMAKALLQTGGMDPCDDLNNEDDQNCVMEKLMYEIINGQNKQIQTMRGVLEALDEPEYADCKVPISHGSSSEDGGSSGAASILSSAKVILFLCSFLLAAMS